MRATTASQMPKMMCVLWRFFWVKVITVLSVESKLCFGGTAKKLDPVVFNQPTAEAAFTCEKIHPVILATNDLLMYLPFCAPKTTCDNSFLQYPMNKMMNQFQAVE